MSLQRRFEKFVNDSGCIPPQGRVLAAVSGGADSVALLRLLHQLSLSYPLHLEVAHLDHSLRSDSAADAAFVAQLCAQLDLPLTSIRRDLAAIIKDEGGNLEEVAREQRRAFLTETAQQHNCDLIALGHHLDDQAETVLQRLLRGAGTTGLGGMRLNDGLFVRPLLSFSRADLREYLQGLGQGWREDASNDDLCFTRNRIRHELLPLLATFNPKISDQLSNLSGQMQQDDDFWATLAQAELPRCAEFADDGCTLDRNYLAALAPALARRVLREAISGVRGDLRGISFGHIDDALCLITDGPPQGELDLPGLWLACRYDKVLLRCEPPQPVAAFALEIDGAGVYPLPGGRQLVVTVEGQPGAETSQQVEFAMCALSFPLTVRTPRLGERLRPSGMSGRKKLQDIFVDAKIPREQRQSALLLLHAEEPLWVIGLRRCEGYGSVAGEPVLRIAMEPVKR